MNKACDVLALMGPMNPFIYSNILLQSFNENEVNI